MKFFKGDAADRSAQRCNALDRIDQSGQRNQTDADPHGVAGLSRTTGQRHPAGRRGRRRCHPTAARPNSYDNSIKADVQSRLISLNS